jgi:hypothetical protein
VEQLGVFQSLVFINSATINTGVQMALSHPAIHSSGYIPRRGIAGSYGSSIFIILRDLHIVFHSCFTKFYSHHQCRSVPFPPHPNQQLLFFVLLMIAILTGVRWNLNVVLISISFMVKDVEHFFMCLLAICTSSFVNWLFSSFALLFNGLLIL